jgi:hypothetical protein
MGGKLWQQHGFKTPDPLVSGEHPGLCDTQTAAVCNQLNAWVNAGARAQEHGQTLITAVNNIRANPGC